MNDDTLRTKDGLKVKHEKKLGNQNALKTGLFTKDAKRRIRETEDAVREVRATIRKIAKAYPDLGLSVEVSEYNGDSHA